MIIKLPIQNLIAGTFVSFIGGIYFVLILIELGVIK